MKINPYGIVAIGPDLDFNEPHGREWEQKSGATSAVFCI